MTLDELLDWTEALRPSVYTSAQKTIWVNDLEAIIWTQIFLQPAGVWRPYRLGQDGQRQLLLPESWRRVYTAYLGAMIDFANGEYTQYENSMTLYNGYMCELGAWYADSFAPARRQAEWARSGVAAYTGLQTQDGQPVGRLVQGQGILALEWRIVEPFDGDGVVLVKGQDSGLILGRLDVAAGDSGVFRSLGLVLPERGRETLLAVFTGDTLTAGQLELWALVQTGCEKRGYV